MAAFGHRLHGWSQMQLTATLDRTAFSGHFRPQAQCVGRRFAIVSAAQPDRDSSWYEQSNRGSKASQPSSSSTPERGQKQRSRHYYESAPKQRRTTSDRGQQSPPQQSRRDSRDVDDESDGPGWWEVPREVRNAQQAAAAQAAAAAQSELDLQPWQEERLLIAAAGSKKKMQVRELMMDLGLDRSQVLSWVNTFRAKPKHEQDKLLAPIQDKIQQYQQQQLQASKQQQQVASDDFWGNQDGSNSSSGGGPLPFSAPNANTGFVPYYERRGPGGQTRGKRLSGEVLRTLEGVYNRSPWPSKEVVDGLYNLHRLSREVVLEWFNARREMDGLPDNPRLAKKARTQAAPAAPATQQSILAPQRQQQQPVTAEAPAVRQQRQPAPAEPAVSRLTARELVALRSSLPSPKKFKGQKLSQELGIKTVEGAGSSAPQVEISGVVFVARDGSAAWRQVWRRRRAHNGFPTQRLDFAKWFSGDE